MTNKIHFTVSVYTTPASASNLLLFLKTRDVGSFVFAFPCDLNQMLLYLTGMPSGWLISPAAVTSIAG